MHYDLTDGVLAQMYGHKRVWLYDWKHHESCYLRGVGDTGWERQSAADLHGVGSAGAFPLVHRLQRWRADIKPGELLYIPEWWGHGALAEEPCVAIAQEFIPLASIFS